MNRSWNLIVLMLVFYQVCNGANVLVWSPRIGHSHINLMGKIADILQEDGNNVTLFQMERDPDVRGTGSRLVNNVIVHTNKHFDKEEWRGLDWKTSNVWTSVGDPLTPHDHSLLFDFHVRACRGLIEDRNMLNMLRSSNFTLAVIEPYDFCAAGIFRLIGIGRAVVVSTVGMSPIDYAIIGLPTLSSYVPAFNGLFCDEMSFRERAENMWLWWQMFVHCDVMEATERAIFHELVDPRFPSLLDLYKEMTAFIFLNVHEFTASARPTMQKVKEIGGVAYQRPQSVKEPFLSVYNQANEGVILFSLGSIVKSSDIPMSTKLDIVNAFSHFPDYEFIWKYEDVDDAYKMFANYTNVHFFKWIPQIDLLGSDKTRVFITHAGMNSLTEATFTGVPVITIPVFVDQYLNAFVAERRGYAYRIAKDNVSETSLVDAIRIVLGEDGQQSEYTKRADMAKRLLRGRVEEARDTIKRCAREAIEFGTLDHLNLAGRDYSVVKYYNIDVVLVACLIILIALVIVVLTLRAFITCLLGKWNRSLNQSNKKID